MLKVRINNFQSLTDVSLDVEGLTILRGESGQGKSAVLRSLRASMTNRWSKGMIREGEKTSSVSMDFLDGDSFICTKTDTSIKYDVKFKDGKNESFEKLRREIPEDLEKMLGQTWIDDGDTKVAIQMRGQYDLPLLIGISHKRLAGVMGDGAEWNKCVNADKKIRSFLSEERGRSKGLYELVENTKNSIAESQRKIDSLQPIVDELKTNFDSFNSESEKYDSISRLIDLKGKLSVILNQENILSEIKSEIISVCEDRECYADIDKLSSDFLEFSSMKRKSIVADEIVECINSTIKDIDDDLLVSDLSESIKEIKSVINKCSVSENVLNEISGLVSTEETLSNVNKVVSLNEENKRLKVNDVEYIVRYISSMIRGNEILDGYDKLKLLVDTRVEINSSIENIESHLIDGRCPLCGNLIN